MSIQVVPHTKEFLEKTISLFISVYSDSDGQWTKSKASEYILRDLKSSPEFCFVAVESGTFLGSIICNLCPSYDRYLLFIDCLQVEPKFRNRGVAKLLLQTVLQKARSQKIKTINLWTDTQHPFPLSWYTSLGFKKNGWIELQKELTYP